MSLAQDNEAIAAMSAARMSTASIALTMGWSVRRTEARLQALREPEPPPAATPAIDPIPVAPPPAMAVAAELVMEPMQIDVLTPAQRRYTGWFLAAGWRPADVADLFDLDLDELCG